MNIYIWKQLIDTAGIYKNTSLGLISLSGDGQNRITMRDKDVGGDTPKYFQRGNCYGFSGSNQSVTVSAVNAGSYGPGNYYNSSTFRNTYTTISSLQHQYWDSSLNNNLWGNTTDTNVARSGGFETGFHIPSYNDISSYDSIMSGFTISDSDKITMFNANPGIIGYNGVYSATSTHSLYRWWTSSPATSPVGANGYDSYCWGVCRLITYGNAVTSRSIGLSIRLFKDEPIQPDSSWTVLYQPS